MPHPRQYQTGCQCQRPGEPKGYVISSATVANENRRQPNFVCSVLLNPRMLTTCSYETGIIHVAYPSIPRARKRYLVLFFGFRHCTSFSLSRTSSNSKRLQQQYCYGIQPLVLCLLICSHFQGCQYPRTEVLVADYEHVRRNICETGILALQS